MYQGPNSCWARRDGVYVLRVRRPGIDTVAEAAGILYLILKDLRRGWTYDPDRSCRKIRMSEDLFERRARYVKTLAVKHGASRRELKVIDSLIDYVLSKRRLPKEASELAKKVVVRVGSVRRRGRRKGG